jgi:hypothetical protein
VNRELYRHTQFGWLLITVVLVPAVILALVLPLALGRAAHPLPSLLLPGFIALGVLGALLFGALEVRVTTAALHWRFGIGLLRFEISLSEIESIKAVRTSVASGWGIHRTRRGWVYNVAGFDALEVQQKSGTIVLIGTDEPVVLRRVLERALSTHGT